MRLRRTLLVLSLCAMAAATSALGCALQPTKVGHGQLYHSGDGRYDPYFDTVHREQMEAADWKNDGKTSRQPITGALSLPIDASNYRIFAAARSKREAPLGGAIEQTTIGESTRAKRLHAIAARLDELHRRGADLETLADDERKNMGADRADPAKVKKKDEVKREVSAAMDAVDALASDARRGSKEAAELASKLKAAWTGKDEDERPVVLRDEKNEEKRVEEKRPRPEDEPRRDERKKPKPDAPAPAKRPSDEKPAAKPAPQPSSDEVFNP